MAHTAWPRRLLIIIIIAGLAGLAGFGWLLVSMAWMEDTLPISTEEVVPILSKMGSAVNTPYQYDCIIVLGAQVKPNGIPSEALYRRMSLAYQYFSAHQAVIITTGGQGPDEPMPEGTFMYQWFRAQGVQAELLAVDDTSRNTRENISNAKALMEERGLTRALIITSDYHVPRALAVCEDLKINAIGAGSQSSPDMWWRNHLRESLSWIKYRLGF